MQSSTGAGFGTERDVQGDAIPAFGLERLLPENHVDCAGAGRQPSAYGHEFQQRRPILFRHQADQTLVAVRSCRKHADRKFQTPGHGQARQIDCAVRAGPERLFFQYDLGRQGARHHFFGKAGAAARRVAATDAHQVEPRRPGSVAGRHQPQRFSGAQRQRLAIAGDRLRVVRNAHAASR